MAITKTIQHPGIQITESQVGSYTSYVTMNNAYIMGYTDRGPIYDYSMITTTSQFTKIYGEPQTQAERYLYTAVKSILTNGGTPVVARMPYDNKQCQAYKALKMKWGDITPDVDNDLKNPVIPLSGVASCVDMNKSFSGIFTTKSITVNDENVSQDYIQSLTTKQVIEQLNPYKSGSESSNGELYSDFEKGFKLNGIYPSALGVGQDAISSIMNSISNTTIELTKRICFYEDRNLKDLMYKSLQEISSKFVIDDSNNNTDIYQIHDIYVKVYCGTDNTDIYYINLFGESTESVSGYSVILAESYLPKYVYSSLLSSELSSFIKLNDVTNEYVFKRPTTFDEFKSLKAIAGLNIVEGKTPIVYIYKKSNETSFILQASINGCKLIPNQSPLISEEYYNYFSVIYPRIKNNKKDTELLDISDSKYLSGIVNVYPTLTFKDKLNNGQYDYSNIFGAIDLANAEKKISNKQDVTLYKIYNYTCNGHTLKSNLSSYILPQASGRIQIPSSGFKFSDLFEKDPIQNTQELLSSYELIGYFNATNNSDNYSAIYGNAKDVKDIDPKDEGKEFKVYGKDNVQDYDEQVFFSVPLTFKSKELSGKSKTYNLDVNFNNVSLYDTTGSIEIEFPSSIIGLTDKKVRIKNKVTSIQIVNSNDSDYSENLILLSDIKVIKSTSQKVGLDTYFGISDINARIRSIILDIDSTFFNENVLSLSFENLKTTGTIEYVWGYYIPYTSSLENKPIVEIQEEDIAKNELLVYLKTIYNDARFLQKSEYNIACLEASLMNTQEMGFKYGLYLDSEACEISNNQYDDLVTVNQFKSVDRSVDKYGNDIDDANFIIVDKQKTVAQGDYSNIGYFTTIIDPFDALKIQRILVSPADKESSSRTISYTDVNGDQHSQVFSFSHKEADMGDLQYWAYESADSWNSIYDDLMDSMDCLQRVRNADGQYIGQKVTDEGQSTAFVEWSIPLTGTYYDDSISRQLMKNFPSISMASVTSDSLENGTAGSIIDHQYATCILVAVCKTVIDQTTGKITVNVVETFFGSLFNEKNIQTGKSYFIGDLINGNSDYIEFYKNNYVSSNQGTYAPAEYKRTDINQIYLKDSEDIKTAALLRGIDADEYGMDSIDPQVAAKGKLDYENDLKKNHIYMINKDDVCIYNLNWESIFTSFSKKESQKIIANTSDMYSVSEGTTTNVAKNFLIDMDRCIKFIKNRDDLQLHFVCDGGLSTIANFCDNIIWNPNKRSVVGESVDPVTGKKTGNKIYEKTGGWITQPYAPDDDPNLQDRYISSYSDIATWRKVVEKIISICQDLRKDCFAIIDAPRQLTLDGAAQKIRRTKFTNDFDKTIGKILRFITGFNTSYAAGYYNWLRTTDEYSGVSYWLPPSCKIIGNYMYLNAINLPWLAPAGLTYGILTGVHALSHNPAPEEEDQIYMKSWNYVKQYPQEGYIVEGQRTLLGSDSVFERVNVRLLFLDLERYAYMVSRNYKYQVNNSYTRQQFVSTLKVKFEDYTLRGGIYDYLIKCDSQNNTPESIDANELRCDFFIKPARLIEYILLNFVGFATGASFSQYSGS